MSTCILCFGQIRKARSVELAEFVSDSITLGDAIRQQIQCADLPPYTSSPSQLTCKTCFNAFKNFYTFLTKVKSNLSNVKTENSFEISPNFQQICAENEVTLKMEPQVILPKIKIEPEILADWATPEVLQQNMEEKNDEKEQDGRFNDNDSDFAWSYDDPMDSLDDNFSEKNQSGSKELNNEAKTSEKSRKKLTKKSAKKSEEPSGSSTTKRGKKRRKNSEESDEDFTIAPKKPQKKKKKSINSSSVQSEDSDDEDYTNPFQTKSGWVRYLRRDQVTQEMIKSGKDVVTIDGLEYKIPSKYFNKKEPKRKLLHPKRDPEGEERIRKFVDLKCRICGSKTDTFTKLKGHFRLQHPNEKFYLLCCERKFRRRFELVEHIDCHDDSIVHACKVCKKSYKTKRSLEVHMKHYHRTDVEKVICDECGKFFNNASLLRQHMLSHFKDETKIFECYICKDSKTFKNIFHLKNHIRAHHTVTKQNIMTVCHICSATIRESYLPAHMKTVHADENRERVQCEICGFWVLTTTLKTHMMKHNDMGVNCKVCGKFLKSSYSLPSHMKFAHGNDYKFKCEYCDKGFFKLLKMKEHVAVKHTREFLFRCRVSGCDRQFRAETNWRNHEKKAHPEEYDRLFKPFYKRDPVELQEFEEMRESLGGII